jgi:hypothetical protein
MGEVTVRIGWRFWGKIGLLMISLFCACFGREAVEDIAGEVGESRSTKIDKTTHDCGKIIQFFEKKYRIPKGLLAAIASVESGQKLWAINASRKSFYCQNLQEAMTVMSLKQDRKNVSIGYMQINWNVHKNSFKDLKTAFTPYYNIKFAVRLLLRLYKKTGSWEDAVRWYNPRKQKPNESYLKKVKKHWVYAQS